MTSLQVSWGEGCTCLLLLSKHFALTCEGPLMDAATGISLEEAQEVVQVASQSRLTADGQAAGVGHHAYPNTPPQGIAHAQHDDY